MPRFAPWMRVLTAAASLVALLTLSACATVPGGTDGTSSAACEEPRIVVAPEGAAAGDEVVVRGAGWGPCNDTPNDTAEPDWSTVLLEWTLGSRSWNAGQAELVDATFEQTVRIPPDATSGGLMMTVSAIESDFVARAPVLIDRASGEDGSGVDGTSLFDGLISVHYGFLFVSSVPNDLGPDIGQTLAGQTNGLLGGAVPGFLFMQVGTHTGDVAVRIAVYDEEPPLGDWQEIVEVSFRPETPEITLYAFDDASDMWLPVDDYRARWSATGMDAGHDGGVPDEGEPAPDHYELALWPAAPSADEIVRVTGVESRLSHEAQQDSGEG